MVRVPLRLLPLKSLVYGYVESGNVLGVKEDSRTGVIQALWNYIKTQNLQDKVDRRVVRADARLRPVRFYLAIVPDVC